MSQAYLRPFSSSSLQYFVSSSPHFLSSDLHHEEAVVACVAPALSWPLPSSVLAPMIKRVMSLCVWELRSHDGHVVHVKHQFNG